MEGDDRPIDAAETPFPWRWAFAWMGGVLVVYGLVVPPRPAPPRTPYVHTIVRPVPMSEKRLMLLAALHDPAFAEDDPPADPPDLPCLLW